MIIIIIVIIIMRSWFRYRNFDIVVTIMSPSWWRFNRFLNIILTIIIMLGLGYRLSVWMMTIWFLISLRLLIWFLIITHS
jgi:hypothetical protein